MTKISKKYYLFVNDMHSLLLLSFAYLKIPCGKDK